MRPTSDTQPRPATERFSLRTVGAGPVADDFVRALADGLGASPKSLPCRFFWRADLLAERHAVWVQNSG